MHWVGLGIITVVLAAAQTSIGSWIAVQGAAPSFLFIAAVIYGFRWTRNEAGIAGWVLGMAADMTSANSIGPQALGFALSAVAANRLRSVLMVDNPIAQLATVGLLGWLTFAGMLVYEALLKTGWNGWSIGTCLRRAAWMAGYTAMLAPSLFWLMDRILPAFGLHLESKRRS